MIQALWSARSGMLGQQLAIDNTANNLSNINTNGYKKNRVEFQDLLYQEMRKPGGVTLRGEVVPTGYQIGSGVKVASTGIMFEQGQLQQTDNPMDYAIEGNAFFAVQLPDGTEAYTRDGALKLDVSGQLVTSEGYPLLDENGGVFTFDNPESVKIDGQGNVYVRGDNDQEEDTLIGRLSLVSFTNPHGLNKVGSNLFTATVNSGEVTVAEEGSFRLIASTLEGSNVNLAEEMVAMMVANRAFELSSRVVRTSDEMLGMANQLLRR